MSNFNGLWLPMADASNSSPSEYDMHKTVNAQLVQSARVAKTFVPRLMANNTPLHMGGGVVNRVVDFTQVGRIGTETHLKGDRYTGLNQDRIQRQVTLDNRPRRTGIQEEHITRMFEQVNTRQAVLSSLGDALAEWDDVEAMKALVDAAWTPAVGSENTDEFLRGGNIVLGEITVGATAGEAKALAILGALEDIAVAWNDMQVPMEGRHVLLPIQDLVEIMRLEKAHTSMTDIAGGIYGNLDIAGDKIPFTEFLEDGKPLKFRGFYLWSHSLMNANYNRYQAGLKSAHVADANHSNRGQVFNSGDLSDVQAIVFHESAVGKADVMSIMLEQDKVPMSTEEYINAMVWVGYGTLHPERVVTLTGS